MVEVDVILTSGDAKRIVVQPHLIETMETEFLDGQDVVVITMASGNKYFVVDPSFAELEYLLFGGIPGVAASPRLDRRGAD